MDAYLPLRYIARAQERVCGLRATGWSDANDDDQGKAPDDVQDHQACAGESCSPHGQEACRKDGGKTCKSHRRQTAAKTCKSHRRQTAAKIRR